MDVFFACVLFYLLYYLYIFSGMMWMIEIQFLLMPGGLGSGEENERVGK